MANIDEHLHEEKPVRYVLFTLARLLFSLENNFTIDDLVSLYERWDWHDPEITEYQLTYEFDNGSNIMPISCTSENEDWMSFCVGYDNCPYDIYSSLPLKGEIFDD
ncbi:hypothetical protein GJR98_17105 [Haloferax sp. MBLA0077]|uniref:Primase-associated C-terminal domain-containing protein n=2 Tax=Haloferax TaxID=2251 RepID=A0A6G1Z789_9EURY|nr:hypothetical protein Hfx1149_17135 [Haloferax sp. CBA1149]MRW82420.1 hypothetical protein [Haloferax marinisediminis]